MTTEDQQVRLVQQALTQQPLDQGGAADDQDVLARLLLAGQPLGRLDRPSSEMNSPAMIFLMTERGHHIQEGALVQETKAATRRNRR